MNKTVEILAPAGSQESLTAAINAGCDAVYMGGTRFGARAYADNPDEDNMKRCIDTCHIHGKKLYMTVNTLFKEKELYEELYSYLLPYYKEGLDAVIVQDEGAMSFINEAFPDLPIHISTQSTIMMAQGADYLSNKYKNITRVVPARELSLEELIEFRKNTKLEMEIFVHGALCYCYSGQCLFSSFIGGRSGNRGRCAQPCRKKYNEMYLLSPKDQCMTEVFGELIEAGVDSFKIEGRMKSPVYTAGVVSVYKELTEKYYELGREKYNEFVLKNPLYLQEKTNLLKDLYNRGGFNAGYLHEHNGRNMMSLARPNHSGVKIGTVKKVNSREAIILTENDVNAKDVLEIRRPVLNDDKDIKTGKVIYEFTTANSSSKGSYISTLTMKDSRAAVGDDVYRTKNNLLIGKLEEDFVNKKPKRNVRIDFKAVENSNMVLSISTEIDDRLISNDYVGPITEKAINQPISQDAIKKQLLKLGDTPFECATINVETEGNVFIPVKTLNDLRRSACETFETIIVSRYYRKENELKPVDYKQSKDLFTCNNPLMIASCWNLDSLKVICESGNINEVVLNISDLNRAKITNAKKISELYGVKLNLGLPYILRKDYYESLKNLCISYKDELCFYVRNKEEYFILKEIGASFRTDYNMYAMNSLAVHMLEVPYTLPLELNENELIPLVGDNAEMIVYGRQPIMFSAQCVYKNYYNHCRAKDTDNTFVINDEMSHDFRTRQICPFCYNIIYNSSCLNIIDNVSKSDKIKPGRIRFDFVFETPEEIMEILNNGRLENEHYTFGHFQRGVQ